MKVILNGKMCIPIPVGLAGFSLSRKLIAGAIHNSSSKQKDDAATEDREQISKEQTERLLEEFAAVAKEFKGMTFVEVISASGETVEIIF